jgi:hypothetical protein
LLCKLAMLSESCDACFILGGVSFFVLLYEGRCYLWLVEICAVLLNQEFSDACFAMVQVLGGPLRTAFNII